MKKASRAIKFFLIALASAILLYGISAVCLSFIGTSGKASSCKAQHEVYVSSNGVHLFMIIPLSDLPRDFTQKLNPPSYTEYLSLGWGDQGFYLNTPTWDDLSFSIAVKALLWPSEAAMHVSYYSQRYPSWQRVSLCESQSDKLIQFVTTSFKTTKGSFTELQATGYSANNYFYRAEGSYTCFRTSNVWVNEALKEAEIKTSVWSPFDWGVMYHLKK